MSAKRTARRNIDTLTARNLPAARDLVVWVEIKRGAATAILFDVALAVETRHALRTRPELVGLVEAIRDASAGEPETASIEWKRELDLSSVAHRFAVARHILGFGNRYPSAAAPYFEGCAYLVVGTEPGIVTGVPEWDPADLHNWLERYIAPGHPRWHPEAVTVDGAHVMIFAIESPSWGDPIHTLQTTYEGHTAGRIFSRRGGKTVEASPSEINRLGARLTRGADDIEIDVVAHVPGDDLSTVFTPQEARDLWRTREERRLRAPLARPARSRSDSSSVGIRAFNLERRSKEQYEAEISDYLSRLDQYMDVQVFEAAVKRGLGLVEMSVHNPTPRNFPATQVELTLPPGARAFLEEAGAEEQIEAPERPLPWGDDTVLSMAAVPVPRIRDPLDEVLYDEGGVTVFFRPVTVRPGATHRLPDLHLIPHLEMAGSKLPLRWRATSTGATRWADGVIELPVSETPTLFGRRDDEADASAASEG
jgi:hypothetical protein